VTRPSKRTNILDAALRVAERDGVTGITLDAVAQEAGLTKAGLMYHFPSREALLWGIQEHLIVFWEGAMEAAAGGTVGRVRAGGDRVGR
jgi:AcrR family transcriptional regulator